MPTNRRNFALKLIDITNFISKLYLKDTTNILHAKLNF